VKFSSSSIDFVVVFTNLRSCDSFSLYFVMYYYCGLSCPLAYWIIIDLQ